MLLMITFSGHKELSVRLKLIHKERHEQRLKVDGKREKFLIVSFEALVPAMPEAGLPRNFSIIRSSKFFLLFIYLIIFA